MYKAMYKAMLCIRFYILYINFLILKCKKRLIGIQLAWKILKRNYSDINKLEKAVIFS